MFKVFKYFLLTFFGFAVYVYFAQASLTGMQPRVLRKHNVVKERLKAKGLEPDYFVCSAGRPKWVNAMLPTSAKNSLHRKNAAIDIYIMDVDQDGDWDRNDIELVKRELEYVDRNYPGLRGGLGTYYTAPFFPAQRTLHFDCRGYSARWAR